MPSVSTTTAPPSKHAVIASWVFGSLLLLFYLAVFTYAPDELPEFKHKMLGIISALLCALFTFFFVGTLAITGLFENQWSKFAVQSGGGAAAFVLILWWWNNPSFAPVRKQENPVTPAPAITQPVVVSPVSEQKAPVTATVPAKNAALVPEQRKKIKHPTPAIHRSSNIQQITKGKNSPAIISGGNVTVKIEE